MTEASPLPPHSPAPRLRAVTMARVFVPFALGYFLSYLYRVVNAVIAPELVGELALDASALGLLTAAYFLTFAAFQLPLGILLDRYGPRRVEAALLVFAALGAALFAWAPDTNTLILARALIGFGVSACLMASFKAFIMWFPIERIPLINGLQLAAGGLGALVATQPVEMMLDFTDWRGVFWIL
ncbi:MFS transporter, partial [Pseudomonadota bacterium]